MANKTTYMIVTGASVVVVRDGKRKPLPAGSGESFTDSEIAAILKAVPGALRKPINEGGRSAPDEDEDDDDAETAKPKAKAKKAPAAKAPAKGKPKAKTPPPADDDDDADEDADADDDSDI